MEVAILAASIAFTLGLALVVFIKNTTSAPNRLFAVFSLLMAAESLLYFLSIHQADALLFIRLVMMNTIFIGLIFKWITVYFTHKKFVFSQARNHEIWFAFASGVLALTPFVFTGVNVEESGNITPTPGIGITIFIAAMVIFMVIPLINMYRLMRRSSGYLKAQLRYIIAGVGLAFVLAFISNFVFAVLAKDSSFVIFTPVYIAIFTTAMWIAIARHKLFNIRLIIARSLTYILLLGSIAAIYAAGLFGLTRFLFVNQNFSLSQNVIYISLAIVISFTFQPLRRFFERITNRIFYRDHYDSQLVINRFSQVLVSELELDNILKKSLKELCDSLHIGYGQLAVFDHDSLYRIQHYGTIPRRLLVVPEMTRLKHGMLVADELPEGTRKSLLDDHGIRVSVPLRTRDDFVGYLLLGDKLSGDIYSTQDITLLEIVSKQLAIGIQNARAYAEIQDFNRTLQARVDQATGRLRDANRHLKDLDQAKDEFISMASHQLRTPLTTIKGYLSMMMEGDAGRMSKTQDQFAGYAFDSAQRMVNLISDLLNVSRLNAGKFVIMPKATDMAAMVADEVRQLQSHASAKGLGLTFVAPPEPVPTAMIDEDKTRQVVMNFIDNAIYYTASGAVTVSLTCSGERTRLEVRDTGIGVPEAAKKKLFSKFFRAGNAQSVRPDGTGLGLYLARRVVEDQGGVILFESVEGQGSMFGFELPLTVVAGQPVATVAAGAAVPEASGV